MDCRMKPLLLTLMFALLCLTVELTEVAQMRAIEPNDTVEKVTEPTSIALYVENGLWGLRTGSGRVIVKPEWYHLRMMGNDILIAKKNASARGLFGMINYSGEVLIPFIYSEITMLSKDGLWAAEIHEGDATRYHLYRSDGTRWSDTAWDRYEYQNGLITLEKDGNLIVSVIQNNALKLLSWHSEHPVGSIPMVMDLNEVQLEAAPNSQTLLHLGDTAASYLSYLFLTPDDTLDPAIVSGEDSSALSVSYHYADCTLQSAKVTRLRTIPSLTFPTYLLQMNVVYLRTLADGSEERVNTSMSLTVSVNASGTYGYSAFFDPLVG